MRHCGSQQLLVLVLILDLLKLYDHTDISDDYHYGRLEIVINYQASNLSIYRLLIFAIAVLIGLVLHEIDLEESLLLLLPRVVLDHFLETDKLWVEIIFFVWGRTPYRAVWGVLVLVLLEDLMH
jgi:hypothetical protein